MAVGLLGVIAVLFGLAVFAFHVWAIIDVVRTPADSWEAARQSQVVWAIVVLLLSVVGPILYLVIARPQLAVATAGTS